VSSVPQTSKELEFGREELRKGWEPDGQLWGEMTGVECFILLVSYDVT
jgi:hypothetical protein